MKNLIIVIFVASIVAVVVIACSGGRKTGSAAPQQTIEDSVIAIASDFVRGRVVEDTVFGHWTVKATKDSNHILVVTQERTVNDSSVFLTVSYDHDIVYSNKEIRTKDVVSLEGEHIVQWGGEVFWASDSALYLSFGCFLPDSDDGWNMLYQILPDGTSNTIVIEIGIGIDGFDVVADFMALYLTESAVGVSSYDLKRLYEHYCTKELVEEVSAAIFPIVSDDTDFWHAYGTLQIKNLDDLNGLQLGKHSFEVTFKPYLNDDNVTDILYMEVDGTTNKIIKIKSGERKVI